MMKLLRTIATEALGLFVDDAGFAMAIVAWLAVAWAGHGTLHIPTVWQGPALFAGLAMILVGSALRSTRR